MFPLLCEMARLCVCWRAVDTVGGFLFVMSPTVFFLFYVSGSHGSQVPPVA